jgi:hypothetical protein
MAFVHGKGAATLFGGTDLSAFLNNYDAAATSDTAEVTVFGNGSKAYIGGLKDATVSLSGFFDGSAGAVDEVLSAALANVRVLTLGPAGFGAIGNRVQIGNVISTSYSINAPVADAVNISAEAQVTGGLLSGIVLADLVARTAAGQTTANDNAASTANGAVATLHLVAFTGTDITIKIEGSADNNTWADLITFAQLTAEGAELKAATGTIPRYLRVDAAGTFTTATFAVALARL